MDHNEYPRPGDIYDHFKEKPYQIITVAIHTETNEKMVVYQALYGDFKTYVRPLSMFLSKVDKEKYPDVKQQYRFEKRKAEPEVKSFEDNKTYSMPQQNETAPYEINSEDEGSVDKLLLEFLEADTYDKKLEIIISNSNKLSDRLINDMAVALDCAVEDGPIEKRVQDLIICLKAMRRFEDRRLR